MTAETHGWPSWATETVEVAAPDPGWAVAGEREVARLAVLLEPWLSRRPEHVGSTAVPGLPAKPILDVQAVVADLDLAGVIGPALAPHGWHLVPAGLDARPWRRLAVRVAEGRRAAHLHLLVDGAPRWAEQIAFRDALRRDPDLARRYATLKSELARCHPGDREAYTWGKTEFVAVVIAGSS